MALISAREMYPARRTEHSARILSARFECAQNERPLRVHRYAHAQTAPFVFIVVVVVVDFDFRLGECVVQAVVDEVVVGVRVRSSLMRS